MKEYIISKADSGQTAIKYLQRLLSEAPNGLLYKQIRKKNITLNGKKFDGHEKLNENDKITVFMSDDTITKFSSKSSINTAEYERAYQKFGNPIIIYEDEHIILMDKPVGVLSQKAEMNDLSANEWLIGYLLAKGNVDKSSLANFMPSVCNRLDRNTGGLLTFGKTLFGTSYLNEMFRNRTGHKFYRTIVSGMVIDAFKVEGYLKKDSKTNKVSISKEQIPDSDLIITSVRPLRYYSEKNITELEIELITGKPHQIRAHLASINHPILGDNKYGNIEINKIYNKERGLKNQLLYAVKLEFPINDNYPELSGKCFQIDTSNIIDPYFD